MNSGCVSFRSSVAVGMSKISSVPADGMVAPELLVRGVPEDEDDEEEEDDDKKHGDDDEEDDDGEGYSE